MTGCPVCASCTGGFFGSEWAGSGRKIIFVANLAPAKLAGELSEGMILAADAGEDDVKVMFVDDSVPAGSRIH